MAALKERAPAKQPRAAAKKALILGAAERLLVSVPAPDLTTKMVAEEAGVPIGSVYRYFTDMRGMLSALMESFNAMTLEAIDTLPDGGAWRRDVASVLATVERMHRAHPAYGPLMAYLGRTHGEDDAILSAISARLADRMRNPATEVAAMTVGIVEAAERRYHGLPESRRSAVFAEAGRAIEAYLAIYLD